MGIISSASGSSCWRGLDYYKNKKIKNIKQVSDIEYTSIACGTKEYSVYLNLKNPRKSTCNCPLANGKRIICKEYQENEYKNVIKFINKMSKRELIEELIHIFDYAPEWVYDNFVKRNDIGG